MYAGWWIADGVASIAIGLLLVGDSTIIALATRSLIAGESASPLAMEDLRHAPETLDEPSHVDDLATLQLGPRALLVAVTVSREHGRSAPDLAQHFDRLTATLRNADKRVAHVLSRFG